MSKTLLQEAKVAKRRADAKKSKNGMASPKVGPVSGAVTTTGVTVADVGGPNPTKPSVEASPNKQTAVATSAEGAAIVASSHLTFAMPDVEAHRDVWALMQFAANKEGGFGQAARFATKESRQKLTQFIGEIIHPLLGAEVPAAWVDAAPGTSVGGAKLAPALKKGTAVSTPYGDGKISEIYNDGSLASVNIPSGPCFVAAWNLLKPGGVPQQRLCCR